jgi:hypothetical protein
MSRLLNTMIISLIPSLISLYGAAASADPNYCEDMPAPLVKAVRAATAAQKRFEQERDDDRADSNSKKSSESPRKTASDNVEATDDNVTLAEFGNHDLDQTREAARRTKELLISAIINEKTEAKPSHQLSHWMACEEVAETLKTRDLNQLWAKKQVHRFEVRWDQVRRGVKIDTVATVETRDNFTSRHSRHSKKVELAATPMNVADSAVEGDEDSPRIATHKLSTDNLSGYRMVTTRTPAPPVASVKHAKKTTIKVARHQNLKNKHSLKVAKSNSKARNARLAHMGKITNKSAKGKKAKFAKNASAVSCQRTAAHSPHDGKARVCVKKPSRHSASITQKVAKI